MSLIPLRPGPRWARRLGAATTVGLVANGLRLRRRATALARVAPGAAPAPDLGRWRVITATGVELEPSAVAAAIGWAEAEGLDAVDVVPTDLPVERALDLFRQVDPAAYRTDPLLEGRTAGHAVVVREDVAKRADLPTGSIPPAEFVELARQVKRFAPRTSDVAVVPGVRALAEDLDDRRAVQKEQWDRYSTLAIGIPAVQLGALGVGAVVAPAWGVPAMAAYLLQPLLVHVGGDQAVRPRDLARHVPRRWVDEVRRLIGTAQATAPPGITARTSQELRPHYAAELEQGLARFFEARATACPWCGSGELSLKISSPDLIQQKPGTFDLDECGACGHIFQNPRLSIEGLDFYYRDFYDGLGAGEMERIFASEREQYDGRVEMVAEHTAPPRRWLDVGTGHAHFCLVAQGRWPEAIFEGVDMSSSIEEAADRGWVATGHRGLFPELAPSLADRYDVVSMHHYLEHTREPKEELDAAATVLEPGGHLMIEVPDPECVWGRLLGNRWLPWFQPQHQHFVSLGNLEEALEARGFTVVARHRTRANQALDLLAGMWLSLGQIAPRPGMPWLAPATLASRTWRTAVCVAALPLMAGVAVLDKAMGAIPRPDGIGNTYRVLARYDGPPSAEPTPEG